MKSFDESSSFYHEAINLIDLNDYEGAIKSIRKSIDTLNEPDDIALAYLNCGFMNDKLGDYLSAIDDFSRSISIEAELEMINQRSKDVALNGRSNSRYKNGNYHGAIEDKSKSVSALEKHLKSLDYSFIEETDNNAYIDFLR